MAHRTLISAADALTLTGAVWFDCRFDLADPGSGRRAHADGHLPGAFYLHLDDDLSGDKHDGEGRFRGRHPLPDRAAWATLAGRLGVAPGVQVVAYDAQGGPYAARVWWLLRWLGHAEVAVLDGGLAAWRAAGGALAADAPSPGCGAPYPATPAPAMPVIDAESLHATLGTVRLVDARAPERFRGEVEPLDAAAGHIPGAGNFFFKNNLAADGRFRTADELHRAWAPWVDDQRRVVHQCGSGVTACHNLLAMAHAGLGDSVLYPGSWSEWSSDPARPVAVG